jgi:hypothetical protein
MKSYALENIKKYRATIRNEQFYQLAEIATAVSIFVLAFLYFAIL